MVTIPNANIAGSQIVRSILILLGSMGYSARAMPENLAWIALWSGSSGAQTSQK
jgi:hypothetical protein